MKFCFIIMYNMEETKKKIEFKWAELIFFYTV